MPEGHDGETALTPEAIAEVRSRIGQIYPAKPWWNVATSDVIRHFAEGYGDHNPLFRHSDYARQTVFGRIVAPPTFLYCAISAGGGTGGIGLPGAFAVQRSDEWEFFSQIYEGDSISGIRRLVSLEEKDSRWGGRIAEETMRTDFYRNGREHAATLLSVSIRSDRRRTREVNEKVVREPSLPVIYSDEDLDNIAKLYDAEEIRGGKARFFEDVQLGDSLGVIVRGPLSVRDIIAWWMGRGAPYMKSYGFWHDHVVRSPGIGIINPVTNVRESPEAAHFDEELARRSGMEGTYDVGMLRVALCSSLLTNWCGDHGVVKRLKVWLDRPHYCGETAWITGSVTGKTADGDVAVSLEMKNQADKVLTHAEGLIRLPTKANVNSSPISTI